MDSISRALQRIKEDLEPYLPAQTIEQACCACGHQWRKRLLEPVVTVHLFVLQVLHLNTAIAELRHLVKFSFAPSAYCQARKRLPLSALASLLRRSSDAMTAEACDSGGLWRGLRAFLLDGSSSVTPDTPALAKAFGYPPGQKKGCGFPVAKLLGLFDAFSGMVVELLAGPLFTHDLSIAWSVHPRLGKGDLLVADRGLCSFAHLALLAMSEVPALFRMHQKQIVNFHPGRKSAAQRPKGRRKRKGGSGRPTSRFYKRLAKHDQLVWWTKPPQRPKWMEQEQFHTLPGALLVREIRYRIAAKGQRTRVVTIATTLLDPLLYPKEKIAELYNVRWRVEGHLRELKTSLKMNCLKCKTVEGVKKELAVYCLVYNLVHAVMAKAALRQGVAPDRISFIDALRWLISAEPGAELIDLVINPRRPDRHEPRIVKKRHGKYSVMTKPRHALQKALKKQGKSLK
jgi:hypothetical protein